MEVKQFHENYGYDLKSALSKYAISEIDGVEKDGNVSKMIVEGQSTI